MTGRVPVRLRAGRCMSFAPPIDRVVGVLTLRGGHGKAGNLEADRAQVVPAREVEGLPVVAAESQIGGGGRPVNDAAELLAAPIHDPDSPGPAAVHVALRIDLHAIGYAGVGTAQVGEDAVRVAGQGAVGQE